MGQACKDPESGKRLEELKQRLIQLEGNDRGRGEPVCCFKSKLRILYFFLSKMGSPHKIFKGDCDMTQSVLLTYLFI